MKFVYASTLSIAIAFGTIIAQCWTAPVFSPGFPSLFKVSAENFGDLDPAQWTDVKTLDGKKVRLILSDEAAVFTIPSWWGKSARPQEGEIFILEIDYKDIVSNLIIISSFGNCANVRNERSELHRIAGNNTSTWRTAFIPVSWDYLYAGNGNPTGVRKQELSIQLSNGDKNLPISEIRVRRATKSDEVRYNAETRQWIKEQQKKYLIKDSSSSAELPDAWRSKAIVPYLRNYLHPILPSDAPTIGEAGASMNVRMALNETECRQLGVYANGRDLNDISVNVSALKNKTGELFTGTAAVYTVEYAVVKEKKISHKVDAQRIWPVFATPIRAGKSQAFWITFKTDAGSAKAGRYTGSINILTKGKPSLTIPLEIEVMPIKLLTMDEAGLSMGGCVTGYLPFHDIAYARENNINAANLWFKTARPAMNNVNGKLILDFTLIDEWMKQAKRMGMQNIVYFLGGDPSGFPRTMSIEQELFVLMHGGGSRDERTNKFLKMAADPSNRDRVPDEVRELYSQWVREVTLHAANNGWPELILTPFDEPAKHMQRPYQKDGYEKDSLVIGAGPWIKSHFEDACTIIRKSAPRGTRIYGSIHEVEGIEFLPVIDVFCTNVVFADSTLGDKVRAGGDGKHFWQYTGIGSGAASEPAKMRYSFGFYFGSYNSRGSLLWAYNWGEGRFNSAEGVNWKIVWDTPFSAIPTLSYEGLREAWDDRRFIETLKAVAGKKGRAGEVQSFLDSIFNYAKGNRVNGGEDTVNDFWSAPKTPEKLDEWRYLIANKIIELL